MISIHVICNVGLSLLFCLSLNYSRGLHSGYRIHQFNFKTTSGIKGRQSRWPSEIFQSLLMIVRAIDYITGFGSIKFYRIENFQLFL